MNGNAISILNATLGMKGISNTNSSANTDSDVSFGDVLGQAVNAMKGINNAVKADTDTDVNDKKTFAELAESLSERIEETDGDIINAAVKLIQAVGKAVEALMGKSGAADDENDAMSVFELFGGSDDENKLDDVIGIFDSISELLKTGSEDADMSTDDVVSELMDILKSDNDDDENTLADAVMSVLCTISGTEFSVDGDLTVADNAAEKLSGIIDTLSADVPADLKIQLVSDVLSGKTDDIQVKFADFITKQDQFANSMQQTTAIRINNVSEQIKDIRPSGNDDLPEENVLLDRADVQADIQPTQVYKELSEIVSRQVSQQIIEKLSDNSISDAVKELTVVLKPEGLGEVAVKLVTDGNTVSVVLSASNAEIGRAMSENASALTASLAKQNVEISSVNVVNPSEASSYMGLDFTNQGFNRKGDESDRGSENGGRNSSGGIDKVGDISSADDVRALKLLKEAKLWLTA